MLLRVVRGASVLGGPRGEARDMVPERLRRMGESRESVEPAEESA